MPVSFIFYGVQTLRKASPIESCDKIVFQQTKIEDYPRLTYRGMHLDVGRTSLKTKCDYSPKRNVIFSRLLTQNKL